jgi:hypothetical protein
MGSPESRVIAGIGRRALPLIDTDDTDQQKEQGNGRREGGCHPKSQDRACWEPRAVPHESSRNSNSQGRRVRSFLEVQIGRRRELAADKGLRLFESALRRKIGQLSVLKFELPFGPKRHF